MESQRILKIQRALFPEDRFIEFETLKQVDEEFEYLRLIRKAILKAWKKQPGRKDFLLRGIDAFQEILEKNLANVWNILINQAYLYEYLDDEVKSNECIEKAVEHQSEESIIENAGRYFCHFTKRKIHDQKKWIALLEREDKLLGEVSEGSRFMVKFQKKYGNDASRFASEIIGSPERKLSELKNDLLQLLKLRRGSSFRIDLFYLDRVIVESLKNSRDMLSHKLKNELSNLYSLLFLIKSDIARFARGDNDPDNFGNYHDIVRALHYGRKNGLDDLDETDKYYKNEEQYLEKAFVLGSKKIRNLKRTDNDANKFYCWLADMHRIRGDIKGKQKNRIEDSINDFERAIELYEKVNGLIAKESFYVGYIEGFAHCYKMLGEYDSAIKLFNKLIKSSQQSKKYKAALGLGGIYFDMRNLEKSEYWYLEAKKIDGDNFEAYNSLVKVKKNQGEYAEAIRWREKMFDIPDITIETKNFLLFDMGQLFLEEGKDESLNKAVKIFKDIVENRQPDSLIAYDRLVKALMRLESYKEAIIWLKKKIELNNIDKISAYDYCRLGDCYSNVTKKFKNKEEQSYVNALSLISDYLPAHQRIVSLHERKNEYKEAIETIYEMLAIVDKEESDGLWKWMGGLKEKKGDQDGAFEAFKQSLTINPYQRDIFRKIKHWPQLNQNKKELRKSIEALKRQYQNKPSEELAEYLVNISLSIPDPENAKIAEEYLNKSGIDSSSSNYISKKAYILEIQERFKEAINLRKKLIPLGKIPIVSKWNKLSNLKRIIQSINEYNLYNKNTSYRILEAKAFEYLVKILESRVEYEEGVIPTVETDEKIKGYINEYREDIRLIAEKYHDSGKYPMALNWIHKLTTHPELSRDKVYLFKEAEILFSLDLYPESMKVLDKVLKYENNQDALAFILKGKIKREREDFSNAADCFKKALKINKSEDNDKVPATLDQLGYTYRCWARQTDLTDKQQIKDLKKRAIDSYKEIIAVPGKFDRRAYHGMAQSYLLEPTTDVDTDQAVHFYFAILYMALNDKEFITKKDLDQIALYELLRLWEKEDRRTLKKVLLDESSLVEDLSEYNKNFVQRRIIQAAKRINIFEKDVFNTIKAVFQSSSNDSLRQHCCQYFMKYLINESFNVSEQELQNSISTIIDMIISDSQKNKNIAENLAWFLSGERNAYLDLLTQEFKKDLDEISSTIFKLTKDDLGHNLDRISSQLESAKFKLKNIGLTKVEPENIFQEIHSRSEGLYKRRIGNRMKLETNIFELEGTIVSKKDWRTKEVMILDCFDLMKEIGLQGTCTLNVNGENESKNDPISIKLRAILNGSHEEVSKFRRKIKQKITPKTSFKIHKGTQDSVGNPPWVFEVDLWLEKIFTPDKNPFEEFSEFISKNFFHNENQVVSLNEQISKNISSIDSTEVLKNKLTTYLYHQMVQLTDQARDRLAVILDKPHKLKNWSERPPEELWSTIEEIQMNFQSLKLMTKQFYFSGEDISFSLSDIIDQRIKVHRSPIIPITFQREENSNYRIVGDKEGFEIMINNLCFNSIKSVKKKQDKKDKYEPEIAVRLSTNKEEGEYALRFQDNGIGIDPSTTIEDQELGFGLRAVSYFLHNCDGEITIEEASTGDNSGVTFLITIPIREEE